MVFCRVVDCTATKAVNGWYLGCMYNSMGGEGRQCGDWLAIGLVGFDKDSNTGTLEYE